MFAGAGFAQEWFADGPIVVSVVAAHEPHVIDALAMYAPQIDAFASYQGTVDGFARHDEATDGFASEG